MVTEVFIDNIVRVKFLKINKQFGDPCRKIRNFYNFSKLNMINLILMQKQNY